MSSQFEKSSLFGKVTVDTVNGPMIQGEIAHYFRYVNNEGEQVYDWFLGVIKRWPQKSSWADVDFDDGKLMCDLSADRRGSDYVVIQPDGSDFDGEDDEEELPFGNSTMGHATTAQEEDEGEEDEDGEAPMLVAP